MRKAGNDGVENGYGDGNEDDPRSKDQGDAYFVVGHGFYSANHEFR
jgi:hypothetical protein